MSWWCSAVNEPWNWSWKPYPGIWLLMIGLGVAYAVAMRSRHRSGRSEPGDQRKAIWFGLGLALFWLTTDWPLGTLGAGYLATVHMVQYQLYTLVVAPLLLLGLPESMYRSISRALRLDGVLPQLARPLVAGILFNVILLLTHAPFTVDNLRTSQFGSFALDMAWVLSGFILWLPIISPAPEQRHHSAAVKCIYLFLAAGALAMVPGAIITFASFPLYRIYELAPRVTGLSALDDQQTAGVIMKIANIPVIWAVMLVIFFKWAEKDRRESRHEVVGLTDEDLRRLATPEAPADADRPG